MKDLGFASVSAINQYLRYAESRGLLIEPLLAKGDMRRSLIASNTGRVRGVQFQSLLKALIESANDPLLGLHSSEFVQVESYNVLGTITLHCQTIGEAIERIPPYERLVGDMGTTRIAKDDYEIKLSWHCAYPDPVVSEQMVDNVLSSWTRYARWLAQQKASASKIYLRRAQPDPEQQREYEAFFACPVLFGQNENAIVLDNQLLELKLERGNVDMLRMLESAARSQMSSLALEDESFAQHVLRSIRAHLQMGSIRKELVAQEFNICERTLQRRLNQEGKRYQTLLNEARFERAKELLTQSDLSLREIAFNIGYSDERSFFRGFKKWMGMGPSEYRSTSSASN